MYFPLLLDSPTSSHNTPALFVIRIASLRTSHLAQRNAVPELVALWNLPEFVHSVDFRSEQRRPILYKEGCCYQDFIV